MAVVPASHTFGATTATSSEQNTYVRDPITFALNKPAAELRQTVAQTLATSTWTALLFDAEDLDTDNGHSTTVNTSRYTAVYAGWYLLGGGCGFVANATGRRGVRWAVNGTALNGSHSIVNSGIAEDIGVAARAKRVFLNVGDYVELQAIQISGGNLNTYVTGEGMPTLTIGWDRN